jgi:hypothetical protein
MADSDNAFFGLKVPEGTDRRELYKSQYRAIYTYKMSASELDEAFRTAVTGDGPDGGWSIKNDERVKYVGKLEVSKGDDTTLKVRGGAAPWGAACAGRAGSGDGAGPPPRGCGRQARAPARRAAVAAGGASPTPRPCTHAPTPRPCAPAHRFRAPPALAGDDGGLPGGRHERTEVLHRPELHEVSGSGPAPGAFLSR